MPYGITSTSVVSSQITIWMAGWSEINQFAQAKPNFAMPYPV